jgi:hypothetical protein
MTVALLGMPGNLSAIPAFTRKYQSSCSACHAPAPRLTASGRDFTGAGYRIEGKESERSEVKTGDELLTLQDELPLAIRFDAFAMSDYRDGEDMTDLKTPYGIKLISGGTIAEHIAYYANFYMSERGKASGVKDAFVRFNNLFRIHFGLSVGQFQVSRELFNRELRTTYEDYQIYATKVGQTSTDLTYDRGVIASIAGQSGTEASLGLVNGNGIETAGDFFDTDDWKNVLARFSQGIGPLRVGAFGYFCAAHRWNGSHYLKNKHSYLGIDGSYDGFKNVQLKAQYLRRMDDNPFFRPNPVETKTSGAFVETVWAVHGALGRSFVTLLYNHVDSDQDELYANAAAIDYRSEALNLSYLLRRNVRISGEVIHKEIEDDWSFLAGMGTAF